MTERTTYTGLTIDREIHVRATVGGYAPLITVGIDQGKCSTSLHLNEYEAEELAKMLLAAVKTIAEAELAPAARV